METVRPFPHNKDMSLLAVKLLVTPLMVLAASLVGIFIIPLLYITAEGLRGWRSALKKLKR